MICPSPVICFSKISGGFLNDDVTSGAKSMTNYTRIYECLGLKGLKSDRSCCRTQRSGSFESFASEYANM